MNAFINRKSFLSGLVIVASTMALVSAAHASQQSAEQAAVDFMSTATGIAPKYLPVSDTDAPAATTHSEDRADVLVAAPQRGGFDRVCRFNLVRASGSGSWQVSNMACTQG
ncbi:hypothetical protein [Paraburkholderia fungorum]|uniref:hypothetical protein n=1 Tax=Paraburkholderia fungorum TaxID=134537 RepID=UPI001619FB4E|nr:hypothetical protein [Paraburkholderia fungorum]MBB5546631.1 hypothetical protein [Paraburkholderia fungorum]